MGFFDRLFKPNTQSSNPNHSARNSPPIPTAINYKKLEEDLESRAQDAIAKYLENHPHELDQFMEQEEVRYARYYQLTPRELESLSENGDAIAQYFLGQYYADKGGDSSMKIAQKWFVKSAEGGCTEGMHYAGGFYAHGFAGEKNIQKALQYFKKAAATGYCYTSAVEIATIYTEEYNKYRRFFDLEELMYWITVVIWGLGDDSESGMSYKALGSLAFDEWTDISLRTALKKKSQLPEYYAKEFNIIEKNALIAYYWGKQSLTYNEQLPFTHPNDLKLMLINIGECARELNKPNYREIFAYAEKIRN